LHPAALVLRKYAFEYPPVASTTASPEWDSILPVTRLRVTIPLARPSITTKSSISVRGYIFTVPLPTCRLSAW
jgi:hypothetical protein